MLETYVADHVSLFASQFLGLMASIVSAEIINFAFMGIANRVEREEYHKMIVTNFVVGLCYQICGRVPLP